MDRITKSDSEWRRSLSPDQFHVLREKGTELAFSGRYHDHHEPGIYRCAGCGLELFSSEAKYNSGSGWPSFSFPIHPEHVAQHRDLSHGMARVEVTCPRCGGHLGHVFRDGPPPTGLRYCINSRALDFTPGGERR